MTRAPRISIVVPCRNSSRTIEACLRSAREQDGAEIELVVVDNHSTDGTAEVAAELADVFLVCGPERSAQRNAGARAAAGEILVFVDSDMILPSSLAVELLAAVELRGAEAVVIPELGRAEGFWGRCKVLEKRLYVGLAEVEAARAFTREAFERSGGFDERVHSAEDWLLADALLRAGARQERTSSPIVHDEGRVSLRRDLAKKFYYGRTIGIYIGEEPGTAARRLARLSVLGRAPLLAREPVAAAGLLVLKSLELFAVALGVVAGRRQPRPVEVGQVPGP